MRPVAVEQFRCSSIFDVAVETSQPESRPAITAYASDKILAAMRANYPDLTFEFVNDHLIEKPSRLQRLIDAMSR